MKTTIKSSEKHKEKFLSDSAKVLAANPAFVKLPLTISVFFITAILFTLISTYAQPLSDNTNTPHSDKVILSDNEEYPFWPTKCCNATQFCTTVLVNDSNRYLTKMITCPNCDFSCPERCPECKRVCPGIGYVKCGNRNCFNCPCPIVAGSSGASSSSRHSLSPLSSSSRQSSSSMTSPLQASSTRSSLILSSAMLSSSVRTSSILASVELASSKQLSSELSGSEMSDTEQSSIAQSSSEVSVFVQSSSLLSSSAQSSSLCSNDSCCAANSPSTPKWDATLKKCVVCATNTHCVANYRCLSSTCSPCPAGTYRPAGLPSCVAGGVCDALHQSCAAVKAGGYWTGYKCATYKINGRPIYEPDRWAWTQEGNYISNGKKPCIACSAGYAFASTVDIIDKVIGRTYFPKGPGECPLNFIPDGGALGSSTASIGAKKWNVCCGSGGTYDGSDHTYCYNGFSYRKAPSICYRNLSPAENAAYEASFY